MISSEREHLQAAPKEAKRPKPGARSSGLTACASATAIMPLSHATDFIATSKIVPTLAAQRHLTSIYRLSGTVANHLVTCNNPLG